MQSSIRRPLVQSIRRINSSRWIDRHVRDPFVKKSVAEQARSRSAYKLQEIDQKHKLLASPQCVIDLGASPGGWSLYVARHSKARTIIAVDLLEMEPIAGVQFVQGDFTADSVQEQLRKLIGTQPVSVVLSDMAPNFSGSARTDHLRSMELVLQAFEFATTVLADGGSFLCKYFQGSDENSLILPAKAAFQQVRRIKPQASRKESSEMYLLCSNFQTNSRGDV